MKKVSKKTLPLKQEIDQLLGNDQSFTPWSWKNNTNSQIVSNQVSMLKKILLVEFIDDCTKIGIRVFSGIFFFCLLWWQNQSVFSLVDQAVKNKQLTDLGIIFSILVSATLAETYFIAKTVIQWLFKDINYEQKINSLYDGIDKHMKIVKKKETDKDIV